VLLARVDCSASPSAKILVTAHAFSRSNDVQRANDSVTVEVTLGAFLGVEDPSRPWVKSWTNGAEQVRVSTARASEGNSALVFGCGYTAFESPTFETLELGSVGTTIDVDMFVPTGASGWIGDISASLDIPGAGINSTWLGAQSLGALPQGRWVTVSFPLDSNARSALLGNNAHARLRFAMNSGICGTDIYFDHVRFGGPLTCQDPPPALPSIVSSSVLTFDGAGDWSSNTPTQLDSMRKTQGAASLKLSATSWSSTVSRPFASASLTGVTDRFGLDVFVPSLSADFYWFGHLNAFVECPSVGLYKTFIGNRPLQILHEQAFNRVEFNLSDQVMNALQGGATDCRFSFDVSQNENYGPLAFDNGGFVQGAP
jgi:hypothetical protein